MAAQGFPVPCAFCSSNELASSEQSPGTNFWLWQHRVPRYYARFVHQMNWLHRSNHQMPTSGFGTTGFRGTMRVLFIKCTGFIGAINRCQQLALAHQGSRYHARFVFYLNWLHRAITRCQPLASAAQGSPAPCAFCSSNELASSEQSPGTNFRLWQHRVPRYDARFVRQMNWLHRSNHQVPTSGFGSTGFPGTMRVLFIK